ncbi:MAG TPA: rhodanese-related sulfurtransferase [Alphaproteobacteria bacterium]|nr:rhodanese-related sulfurtransferase [Alphaproteobacteria bacterium]
MAVIDNAGQSVEIQAMSFTVATFYHFVPLADAAALQPLWKKLLVENGVTGTILLTPEGVNATIAGSEAGVSTVLATLRADPRLAAMPHKVSVSGVNPFPRTKVKLKRETIPLGVAINPARAGEYVKPEHWNALIADPSVVVVDARNAYEVDIGRFERAQNPNTRTFKELPEWLDANLTDKDTPVAMYCTGGIRCEKSTAYLKERGFSNVYHLEGGILKYLEDVPEAESLWRGACYVFDDRVALNHDLSPALEYQVCRSCNAAVNAGDVRRVNNIGICPVCAAQSQPELAAEHSL